MAKNVKFCILCAMLSTCLSYSRPTQYIATNKRRQGMNIFALLVVGRPPSNLSVSLSFEWHSLYFAGLFKAVQMITSYKETTMATLQVSAKAKAKS